MVRGCDIQGQAGQLGLALAQVSRLLPLAFGLLGFISVCYILVEGLAELQDFAADAMESYPRARLHGMRWVLVEAADRVLPEIDIQPRPSCSTTTASAI